MYLVFALVAASSVAGCMEDLERVPLETRWMGDGQLSAGPVAGIQDRPAQMLVEGGISISNTSSVTLTGVTGSLEGDNGSVPLQPIRLTVGNRTFDAPEAVDGDVELSSGDRVELSLLPQDGEDVRLTEGNWTGTAELLYRYRDGSRFDAGRFTFNATLTLEPAPSLGVGVASTNDTGVRSVVFEDLQGQATPGEATLSIFHVGGGGADPVGNRTVELRGGEGVVIAELDTGYRIPEGSGYTLFQLTSGDAVGMAAHPDLTSEQPLPFPGVVLAILAILALAVTVRRRT